jgi:hypothetical protein
VAECTNDEGFSEHCSSAVSVRYDGFPTSPELRCVIPTVYSHLCSAGNGHLKLEILNVEI